MKKNRHYKINRHLRYVLKGKNFHENELTDNPSPIKRFIKSDLVHTQTIRAKALNCMEDISKINESRVSNAVNKINAVTEEFTK
ncbi:unnamed protein product [Adineta steineri]|uniref:Uncharacterized protein n=1 Tax=Adineta steineri TaxID=433720 RepID=A0A814LRC8_9BILA|nr:unnamed protein product [Adineta steineri]CAF3676312.1 unnamed protein product [Adineta steineri]